MHICFRTSKRLCAETVCPFQGRLNIRLMSEEKHEHFMRAALEEARKGLSQTSPNPAVGAVLVVHNRIVARGHHRHAGSPHAEVECLGKFTAPISEDAILYVTLEPCSTTGRTS